MTRGTVLSVNFPEEEAGIHAILRFRLIKTLRTECIPASSSGKMTESTTLCHKPSIFSAKMTNLTAEIADSTASVRKLFTFL